MGNYHLHAFHTHTKGRSHLDRVWQQADTIWLVACSCGSGMILGVSWRGDFPAAACLCPSAPHHTLWAHLPRLAGGRCAGPAATSAAAALSSCPWLAARRHVGRRTDGTAPGGNAAPPSLLVAALLAAFGLRDDCSLRTNTFSYGLRCGHATNR